MLWKSCWKKLRRRQPEAKSAEVIGVCLPRMPLTILEAFMNDEKE
jgi:hypothetical protein